MTQAIVRIPAPLRSHTGGVDEVAVAGGTAREALKSLGEQHAGLLEKVLDESLIDERIPMDLDRAAATTRDLARAGLFVGPSSGAYVRAALDLTQHRECGVIVTLLNDTGERYGSTGLWNVGGK